MTFLNRLLSRIKNERGAYMVFFAILIPILFGCAGLAVDLGNAFARHARLQKAADAAVLAAAYVYDKDDVTDLKTVAHTYLEANLYADTAMRDNYKIDKITKRVYGDGTDETKGVLLSLYASQNVDTTFMRILGLQKIPVSVEATARLVPDSPITGDPGVFGFTMVAGYSKFFKDPWESNKNTIDKNAIYIHNDNVYIHGKIHSNGPISIDNNNKGDKRSVFIEKGAFSSSAKTDLELWSNSRKVDWEHEDNTGPKDNGFYNNDTMLRPRDPPNRNDPFIYNPPPGHHDTGLWAHFNRFGYYDGTSQGQDVLASNTYVDKINIAMEKDNSSVEKVYQYVEKYRNEFSPNGGLYRKDESSCKSGEESIYLDTDGHYDSAGSGRGFSDREENYKQYKIIITDGDITVNPGNCNTSWTNMTIISLHGNVTVNANEMHDRFKAIIYAPNGCVRYSHKVAFEGSIVAEHIYSDAGNYSFYWNPFQFGDHGESGGSGSSGTTGSGGVKQVKLHSNEDKDYSEIEISI